MKIKCFVEQKYFDEATRIHQEYIEKEKQGINVPEILYTDELKEAGVMDKTMFVLSAQQGFIMGPYSPELLALNELTGDKWFCGREFFIGDDHYCTLWNETKQLEFLMDSDHYFNMTSSLFGWLTGSQFHKPYVLEIVSLENEEKHA